MKRSHSVSPQNSKIIRIENYGLPPSQPFQSNEDSLVSYVSQKFNELSKTAQPFVMDQTSDPVNTNKLPLETTLVMEWELIEQQPEKKSEKYNLTEKNATFMVKHNFNQLPDLKEYELAIDNAFEEAVFPMISSADDNDRFTAYIESDGLDPAIFLIPQKVKDFDKHSLLNNIYKITQSNRTFLDSEKLKVNVVIYHTIKGKGRPNRAPQNYDQRAKDSKAVVCIKNTDHSCGYRAITLGIKYHEWNVKGNTRQSAWVHLIQRDSAQRRAYRKLFARLNIDTNIPVDIDKLMEIQSKIQYQIIVINNRTCEPMYTGSSQDQVIYLLYDPHKEHFDYIKEMHTYLGRHHYCKNCNQGFDHKYKHSCTGCCELCRSPTKCHFEEEIHCSGCNKTFNSMTCHNNHIDNGICNYFKYCTNCEVEYTMKNNIPHICDQFICNNCHEAYIEQPHYCYIKPIDQIKLAEEDSINRIIVAFDTECILMKIKENTYVHKPILLVTHIVCNCCWNGKSKNTENCEICGAREIIYYGEQCVSEFVDYLVGNLSKTAEKQKCHVKIAAHNNAG